ncbi:MAG TPA: hypothetical protein PLV42_11195 [bacterium]|nr:hypothetical protein [bacterium]
MIRRSVKTVFIVLSLLIPFALCAADDFGDEFGGGEEQKKVEEEPFDAEKSAADKEDADKKAHDQAIKDLLGDTPSEEPAKEEEEEVAPAKKAEEEDDMEEEGEEEAPKPKKKESVDDILGTKKKEEKKVAKPAAQGLKPVAMVKGAFNFGSYAKDFGQGLMYGSVDEGILGAEFLGEAVFAKATINVRTQNPLLFSAPKPTDWGTTHPGKAYDGSGAVQYNPLMDDNYIVNSIVQGLPYEVYGGMKLFEMLTIRAGKMIPSYGILDKYQHLGVAVGTPLGTRPLLAVEGWIPETDAGFALGFDYDLDDESGITAELMMGTGVIPNISQFWQSQKTMGMYFKGGYRSEMITAMLGFQYRNDYEGTLGKQVPFIGFGLGTIFSYAGFETWLTVDYTLANLIRTVGGRALVSEKTGGLNLSLMPAYNLSLDYGVIDKLQFGVRFDLNYGVYSELAGGGNYLHWYSAASASGAKTYTFKNDAMQMRFGVAINLFAKEYESVRSFAGFTFMMQPATQLVNMSGAANDVSSFGFYNFGLQGGAEF